MEKGDLSMYVHNWGKYLAAASVVFSFGLGVNQAKSDDDLSEKLANPIASLISVPIKLDYNSGYGTSDGDNVTISIQPVIPFQLSEDLALVTRTIVPIVWQDDIVNGTSGEQFGLGDTLQSFFFVPSSTSTSLGELTWGIGPALTWATSTDSLLGAGTWALGPTGLFLFQQSGWTWGALVTQQWGISETRNNVPDTELTALQPFLSYSSEGWTYAINTESSYNWTSEEWSVPINVTVAKLSKIGNQPVQYTLGARYWAESPTGGPDGFGLRAQLTFIFP